MINWLTTIWLQLLITYDYDQWLTHAWLVIMNND